MGARIVSQAVVIVVGVRESREKCAPGVDVASSESWQFSLEFGRSLLARGLQGVWLEISDAHLGLNQALAQCFPGPAPPVPATHYKQLLPPLRTQNSEEPVISWVGSRGRCS